MLGQPSIVNISPEELISFVEKSPRFEGLEFFECVDCLYKNSTGENGLAIAHRKMTALEFDVVMQFVCSDCGKIYRCYMTKEEEKLYHQAFLCKKPKLYRSIDD